jgi:hypothetical protein
MTTTTPKRATSAAPSSALSKVIASTAAEACAAAKLSEEALGLLTPEMGVGEFVGHLMERELLGDAVTVMAHALPKREAVWWACLAAQTLVDDRTAPEVLATLESVESWVYKPSDELRRSAMTSAQKTQFDHPAAWAAAGAFWSSGSMVAPDLPEVPAAPHLTGVAVCGAVQLSAVARDPQLAPKKLREFLAQALDIAKGGSGRSVMAA